MLFTKTGDSLVLWIITNAVISRGGNNDDLERVINDGLLAAKIAEVVMTGIVMTLGDRTYELLSYLRDLETDTSFQTLVARAQEMNANLGEEDGRYLLEHQDEIPEFPGLVYFVFPAWRDPDDPSSAAIVYRDAGHWVQSWYCDCEDFGRLLRRK